MKSSLRAAASALYYVTSFELAAGWIFGADPPDSEPLSEGPRGSPLEVLERIVLPELERPPCRVQFSGGIDSSLLLIVAARLARREGLELPIPLTEVFPGSPESQEREWQELVLSRLNLPEWERLTLGSELDLVGPIAQRQLRRHGLVWPPMLYRGVPALAASKGGTLITGEGGDNVLGAQRNAALMRIMRRQAPFRPGLVPGIALALAPVPLQREVLRRRPPGFVPAWLGPEARLAYHRSMADERAETPLSWSGGVRRVPCLRAMRRGLFQNLAVLGELARVRIVHPLLDNRFVQTLAVAGGRAGFSTRAETLKSLFPGLLPPALVDRKTKARFDGTAFNEHSRAFVAGWTGGGVDSDLVDLDALAEEWRKPFPDTASFSLLHSAWLGSQGLSPTGE